MSDNLKLVFLGAPRTGTKSMWIALSKHSEIANSIVKEPWNRYSLDETIYMSKNINFYKKKFNIKHISKVLLDATPCAYNYHYNYVKNIKMPIKIIYPIRNPFDRLYSTVKQNIVSYFFHWIDKREHDFIKSKTELDYDGLLKFLIYSVDSVNIDWAYKITKNVFMPRFDDIIVDMKQMFDFLNVIPIEKKLDRHNSMNELWEENIFDKMRHDVEYFWNKNIKTISKIIIDDLYKIKDYVYVEDYIIEAENILSDV